jgi:uncharacterized protein
MLFRSSRPPLRRALITGASSGIGAAFARALPEADLLLTGRDTGRLEALAAELRTGSREVRVVPADLADADDLATLIRAAETFAPDLLVNDAGLGTYGLFLETPPERHDATVLVNVAAPVALTRALLPGMIERASAANGRCALLNVASTLAFIPVPYGAVYGASKAFVLSFTEALAAELARQPIDVLAVCPGPVRTRFFDRAGAPQGAPPGSSDPDQVARWALADLGRLNVTFSDVPSALALRPIADLRVGLSRTLALGIGAWQSFRGRPRPPEPEPPFEPEPPETGPPPSRGRRGPKPAGSPP